MPVTIGALRESTPQETRVSLVPEVAGKLAGAGARVLIERGAGERARFPDSLYKSVDWADSPGAVLAGQLIGRGGALASQIKQHSESKTPDGAGDVATEGTASA